MNNVIEFLASRMKEPSTWAGLSSIMVAFKVLPANPDATSALTTAGIAIGGILAALFPEHGAKK